MAKRIALTDKIEVDGVDLSNFARAITFESEDEEIDVSGFNPGGDAEFLQGARVRAVTVEFFMSRGSNEVHQVVFPIHDARSTCDFTWLADSNASVSATNEELRGTVRIPVYSEGATRGDAETTSIRFVAADADDPLTFYST